MMFRPALVPRIVGGGDTAKSSLRSTENVSGRSRLLAKLARPIS